MTHRFTRTDSPVGPLTLVVDADGALAGLYLPDHEPPPDPAGLGDEVAVGDPVVAPLVDAVLAYLQGSGRPLVAELAEPTTGTPFQRRVWNQVAAIPYGQTRTYGEVAAAAGHPGASRAVGAAVARNPLCLAVPCHRVVGRGGAVTGYAGGVALKRRLLAMEAQAPADPQGSDELSERAGAPAPGGRP